MRNIALLISFSVGFLSLSQEILWVRLVSFGQGGRPHAFSIVLVAFLLGIALGAIAGRRLCERDDNLLESAGWVLLAAAAVDLVSLAIMPLVLPYSPIRLPVLVAMILSTAGLKGVLFPIVHHLGADVAVDRVGRSVSRIYVGNVLGSTLGPIVTGFWLLDLVDVERAFALIAASTAAMGCLAIAYVGARSVSQWVAPLALLVLATTVVGNPPSVIVPVALTWQERAEVKHVVQNKHGIIHQLAFAGDPGGDWTYGGNIYDGRINVDMKVNSNQLERSYLLAVLHPSPRRALVIGLSSGANAAVIAGFPGIEVVDVVEINPGYLEIIRMYPEVSPLLADPRVRVHIADARQWLRAHPESRYDLIFQNTTYHWRAYSTQLLSSEYLRELRKHLADGGIAAINTTNSVDLYRTAIDIFTNVVRYNTFAYMSDRPITVRADAERVLRESRIGGLPAFDESLFVSGGIGSRLLSVRPESAQEFIDKSLLEEAPRLITDLNLIPEFRHGQPPLFGALSPLLPPTPLAR